MTNRFNRLGVLGLGRNGCWTGRFGKREPIPCRGAVDALRRHLDAQNAWRSKITDAWQEHDLVFCTRGGLPLDPANVRRSFCAAMSRPDSTTRCGRRGSCATASSHSCQTPACRWRTSRASSGTAARS